jgi:transposase
MKMLYIGIDVSKHKHDCFITNADGEALTDVFTIQNSREGFDELHRRIKSLRPRPSLKNTTVGLEATGHFSDNIIVFLREIGLPPVILNPLHVKLYQKAQSLRKTKTDKSDARYITGMLIANDFKPHSQSSYHSEELKSLTRHRQRMVWTRSRFKVLYDRLRSIVFPELETFVRYPGSVTELKLMLELPTAKAVADCHLTRLANLVVTHSHGRYDKEWAAQLKELAKNSIGSDSPAKALEMQQVIRQIMSLSKEIELIESEIKKLVDDSGTSLMTIPGIGYILAAIILAEVGDITRFATPAKLQAFAGLDPTTYQSGQFIGQRDVMVKRGSTYLRWALLQAARTVSRYDATFGEYLSRKIAEGKHYNSAMGHVAKKLIRVIFKLMNTGEVFQAQTQV